VIRVRLDWSRGSHPDLFTACCGEEGQGRASVSRGREGRWHWILDMLPGDPEPVIIGSAAAAACAIGDVERQVAQWPALIDGASRV
jgi:hypothetical protein